MERLFHSARFRLGRQPRRRPMASGKAPRGQYARGNKKPPRPRCESVFAPATWEAVWHVRARSCSTTSTDAQPHASTKGWQP